MTPAGPSTRRLRLAGTRKSPPENSPGNAPTRRKMLIAVAINIRRVDLSAARHARPPARSGRQRPGRCRAGRFGPARFAAKRKGPLFALPCSPRKLKGMNARRRIPPGQDEFSRRTFLENSFFLESFFFAKTGHPPCKPKPPGLVAGRLGRPIESARFDPVSRAGRARARPAVGGRGGTG